MAGQLNKYLKMPTNWDSSTIHRVDSHCCIHKNSLGMAMALGMEMGTGWAMAPPNKCLKTTTNGEKRKFRQVDSHCSIDKNSPGMVMVMDLDLDLATGMGLVMDVVIQPQLHRLLDSEVRNNFYPCSF